MPGKTNQYSGLDFSNNQLSGAVPENLSNPNIWIGRLKIFSNHFNFDGIEYLNTQHGNIQQFNYSPQFPIKLHSTNHNSPNSFSVSAGGTLSNNTYKWYKNGAPAATKVGDSTFTATDSGRYAVQVTNSVATDLTLVSDTVFYNPAIQIIIKDVTVTEGNTGTTTPAAINVKLSKAANVIVKVNYTTAYGSAVAGQDYVAQSGTLTFNPGQTAKKVSITIKGDTIPESNEIFYLKLSNAVNAVTAAKDSAACTILNDDAGLMAGATSKLTTSSFAVQLSPNPVRERLYVSGLPAGVQLVAVVNTAGTILVEQPATADRISMDVKRVAAGSYFLVVKSINRTISLPFVKE